MKLAKIKSCQTRKTQPRRFQKKFFPLLITLIIILSPLINTLGQDSGIYKYCSYLVAFICSCLCCNSLKKICVIAVGSFCLGILIFWNLSTAVSLVLGTVCALSSYRNKEKISDAILYILYLQLALSIAQLFGLHEYVYLFANYKNPANTYQQWSLCTNINASFLPQVRPSGIFPSPTYYSLFLCSVLLLIRIKKNLSLLSSFAIGLLIAVSGSTFSLLVIFVVTILLSSTFQGKIILVSYFIGMFLYFKLLPDIFLYNFNINDFTNSISARFKPENDLSESVYFQSISGLIFVISALIIVIFCFFKKIIQKPYIISPATVMIFPLLVHNVANSVVYFFLAGLSMQIAYDDYAKNKKSSNKYTKPIQCTDNQKNENLNNYIY